MAPLEDIERALGRVAYGDFGPLDQLAARLDTADGPDAGVWRTAFRTLRYLAGLETAVPPVPEAPDPPSTPPALRRALTVACAHLARAFWLAFDEPSMRKALATLGNAVSPEDRESQLTLELHTCVLDMEAADFPSADEHLQSIGREASERGLASLVVESTAVRALLALRADELEQATHIARRASRMARTEELPQAEYLANLVLARVRRLEGRPHLATRILTALGRVAPPAWHEWLGWELAMAGGCTGETMPSGPQPHATAGLAHVLTALSHGDAPAFDSACHQLQSITRPFSNLHDDALLLQAALVPRDDEPACFPRLVPWRQGTVHEPPYGLAALATAVAGPGEGAVARVAADPTHPAVRALWPGAPVLRTDAQVLEPLQRRQSRTDSALAVLALAGEEGIEEEDLFRAVYGFSYKPAVHRDVLHVMIHRARSRVAGIGEVQREGSRLTLRLQAPVWIPDPRCSPPVDDRVLQFVARSGAISARQASEQLGIPLRSAQSALKELVDEGACAREREGGKVQYRVEDTTFQEPTRA